MPEGDQQPFVDLRTKDSTEIRDPEALQLPDPEEDEEKGEGADAPEVTSVVVPLPTPPAMERAIPRPRDRWPNCWAIIRPQRYQSKRR